VRCLSTDLDRSPDMIFRKLTRPASAMIDSTPYRASDCNCPHIQHNQMQSVNSQQNAYAYRRRPSMPSQPRHIPLPLLTPNATSRATRPNTVPPLPFSMSGPMSAATSPCDVGDRPDAGSLHPSGFLRAMPPPQAGRRRYQ